MKTILCFGDSNTWGYVPGTDGQRFPPAVRWTGVLQSQLGSNVRIVEEGLNGRTTCWDDPTQDDRNGRRQLPFLLDSHAPLDLVIIMLGTNDLKHFFQLSAHDIALGAGALVQMVQQSQAGSAGSPRVLLIAPVQIVETPTPFGHKFDDAIKKSQQFAAAYREIADELGCDFFDAAGVATCPNTDGVHLDAAGHAALGIALAKLIECTKDVLCGITS